MSADKMVELDNSYFMPLMDQFANAMLMVVRINRFRLLYAAPDYRLPNSTG